MKGNRLVKKGLSLIIVVMLMKVVGFLKQSIIAWRFGTSPDLDAYFAADGYMNMFAQIILTAIPPAIVTLYLKIGKKNEKDSFVSSVLVFLAVVGLLLMLVNIILSPFLAELLGVSFDEYQMQELKKFIVLLSPLIVFACFSSVSSGVLQSNNRFIPEKMLGYSLSISIIFCAFLLAPKYGINSLLIGFMGGYLIYSIMMFVLLVKNAKIKIQNPFGNNSFRKFLKIVFPIVIGICTVDLSHLIDRIIASSLASGSVSSLYYSQILSGDLINGVIIASIGVLLLPKLSVDILSKTKNDVFASLRKVFGIMAPILLLITVFYLTMGEGLVTIAFQRGEFTQESTAVVSGCLAGYSVGFIFMLVKEILVRYFYASENTKIPMVANIISIIVNMVLSLVLSSKIGVSGIAFATSISYFISNIVLIYYIRKEGNKDFFMNRDLAKDFVKNIVIIAVSVLVSILLKKAVASGAITETLVTLTAMGVTFIVGSFAMKTTFYNYATTMFKKIRRKK